jgi:ATP-dependent exoDNAse (exonuclease V) alpha subunit
VNGQRQTIGGFVKGESAVVVRESDGRMALLRENGTRGEVPVGHVDRFDVFRARELKVARGDRLRLTRNGEIASRTGAAKRVSNGDIYTVKGFTRGGDVRLTNGDVLPKNYGHVSHGFVSTSYAAQGQTVQRVFVSVGDRSIPAVNAQQWYVSLSRGKESAKVYVEDKAEVRAAAMRGGERLSAVELMKPEADRAHHARRRSAVRRSELDRFRNGNRPELAVTRRQEGRSIDGRDR